MERFTPDARLRDLLHISRRHAGLTQRDAAQLAEVDESWWKKVESGRAPRASLDIFARMAIAAKLSPETLELFGYTEIARVVRVIETRQLMAELDGDKAEAHLAQTPGTTARERLQMIEHFRRIRALPGQSAASRPARSRSAAALAAERETEREAAEREAAVTERETAVTGRETAVTGRETAVTQHEGNEVGRKRRQHVADPRNGTE